MIHEANRSNMEGSREEAPQGDSPPNIPTKQEGQHDSEAHHDGDLSEKRQQFTDSLQEAEASAHNAGQSAARKLGEGILQGVGRRAGELLWDMLTGNQSS